MLRRRISENSVKIYGLGMNPEERILRLKDPQRKYSNLTQTQNEYLNLLKEGKYSILNLCEYYYKMGYIPCFSEIWGLLIKLDQDKNLIEPQIADWEKFDFEQNMSIITALYEGKREKIRSSELQMLPFFRNLKKDILEYLAENSRVLRTSVGMQICVQGQEERSLFVILEGQVSIYRKTDGNKKVLLTRAEKGSVIGEVGFFLGQKRTADVHISKAGKIIQIRFDARAAEFINADVASTLKERFWVLQALVASEFFKNLPESAFDDLVYSGKFIRLKENDLLFREGQVGDSCYLIIQGAIVISKENKSVSVLKIGDSFGEIAALKLTKTRTATAVAQAETLLLEIPNQKLLYLVFNHLTLGVLLEKIANDRMSRDQKRIAG
jgi:CRP-like cAMP-binding protein